MTLRFGTGLSLLALSVGALLAPGCKVTVREGVPDDGGVSGAGGGGTGGSSGAGATGGSAGSGGSAGAGGSTGGSAGAGGSTGGSAGAGGSTGGSAGAGGSTGGSAGSGTGGSAGAGTGGSAGVGGTAGSDGGLACLGDDPVTSTVDGGATCAALPYAASAGQCASAANPYGLDLCLYFAAHARPGVLGTLVNCLALADATDPCGAVHDAAVDACLAAVVAAPKCSFPDIPAGADAGVLDCAGLAASCPADADAGAVGISEAECLSWVGLFDEATRADVVQCYNFAQPGLASCRADFLECAAAIDYYPGDGQ